MADKVKKIIDTLALIAGTAQVVSSAVKKAVGKFNERGEELVDGRPMEPPLGHVETIPLAEQIAQAVRAAAFQKAISEAGGETFEESEDFDVGDDFDPSSPYEAFFEPITEREFDRLAAAGYIVKREEPAVPAPPAATPPASGPGSQPTPSSPPGSVAAV